MKQLNLTIVALACAATMSVSYAQTSGITGSWDLKGNSATDITKNFIGTLDPKDVIFKTSGKEVFRLTPLQGMQFNSWYNPVTLSYTHPPLVAGTGNEIRGVDVTGPTSNGGFLRLSAGGGTSATAKSYIDLSGSYGVGYDIDRNIVLGTSGMERVRVDSSGNVGIGISAPAFKLDINGAINLSNAGSLKIGGATVFKSGGDVGNNILIGALAGLNPSGWNLGVNNIYVGGYTGFNNDGGNNNVFLGESSGRNVVGAYFNTYLGVYSGQNGTAGWMNTFTGYASGRNASGSYNTFNGTSSGLSTTGDGNTFSGTNSGLNNTGGSNNTYLGYQADGTTGTLTNATAIGYNAKVSANNSMVLGNNVNVGIGTSTPTQKLDVSGGGIRVGNTSTGNDGAIRFTGTDIEGYVTGLGGWTSMTGHVISNWGVNGTAIYSLNTGNVGVGTNTPAYKLDVNGDINVGTNSVLRINTLTALNNKGYYNIFAGQDAGLVSTGSWNTFMGASSGIANTTGFGNTALGCFSADRLTTGLNNICIGISSGSGNVGFDGLMSGSGNVMLGSNAGKYCNANATANTYLGGGAGNLHLGDFNTYVGSGSTSSAGSGNGNSSLGSNAATTTGVNYSTAIGYAALATTSGTIALGGSVSSSYPTVVIGKNAKSTGGYLLEVNGSAYANSGWWTASDKNFKKNIIDYTHAMDAINKLRPVIYEFRDDIFINKTSDTAVVKRNFPKEQQIGFIAQELEKVLPNMVKTDEDGYKAVNYDQLFGVIVQGMKEQDLELKALAAENKTLQTQNEQLQTALDKLNARLTALEEKNSMGNPNKIVDPVPANDKAYLEQNAPNPFSENTVIKYYVPEQQGKAHIVIRSGSAQEVLRFTLEHKGFGNIIVSGNSLSSGVYYCELYVNGKVADSKKMLLAK